VLFLSAIKREAMDREPKSKLSFHIVTSSAYYCKAMVYKSGI